MTELRKLEGLDDMRWVWVYYQGAPQDETETQVAAVMAKIGAEAEGGGFCFSSRERDMGFILPSAKKALSAAKMIMRKMPAVARVRITAWDNPDDDLCCNLTVTRTRKRVLVPFKKRRRRARKAGK
jgi:hypothetical protein